MSRYANAIAGAVEREGACRGVRGMVKDTRSAHLRAYLRAEEAGGLWLCGARTPIAALPLGPAQAPEKNFGEGAAMRLHLGQN